MMGKLTIDNLAEALGRKNDLTRREAQSFISTIFDVIQSGIDRDKLVKVKGLGTFKVVGVDARESVSVKTGERVLIDSHMKLSFIPDAAMKELVNKPFSGFETVILNDGVEFEDMPFESQLEQEEDKAPFMEPVEELNQEAEVISEPVTEPVTEPVAEPVAEPVEEPVVEPDPVAEPEPVVELKPEVDPEPAPVADPEPAPVVDTKPSAEPFVNTSIPPRREPTKEVVRERTPWWVVLICLVAGFGMGYVARDLVKSFMPVDNEPVVEEVVSDIPDLDAVMDDEIAEDIRAFQKAYNAIIDSLGIEPEPGVAGNAETDTVNSSKEAAAPTKQEANETTPDYMKYDGMDARLRHGAYYIIGTASVEKAREGDTSEKLSRRYLGKDMACYIEVYNDINASTRLEAGQEIRIPKLITKKAMHERLKRKQ